jgi:hypothetical protein
MVRIPISPIRNLFRCVSCLERCNISQLSGWQCPSLRSNAWLACGGVSQVSFKGLSASYPHGLFPGR